MSNALDLGETRIEGIPLLHSEALGAVYTTTLLRYGCFTRQVLLCSAGVYCLNSVLMVETDLISCYIRVGPFMIDEKRITIEVIV